MVGHRFCFSSLRWGSSFWSSYQLSCLYTFVLSSKSIIEMKSIFVLPMLLILKVGRCHKGNKNSLESEMETDFSISLPFCSHYTDTEISSMVFQNQKIMLIIDILKNLKLLYSQYISQTSPQNRILYYYSSFPPLPTHRQPGKERQGQSPTPTASITWAM